MKALKGLIPILLIFSLSVYMISPAGAMGKAPNEETAISPVYASVRLVAVAAQDGAACAYWMGKGSNYTAGYTNGTFPGQTSAGSDDCFIRKSDADGNELWTRQFGTEGSDWVRGGAVDASGVYVVGHACYALPGQSSAGPWDAFIRKYDADGNEIWTRQFGSSKSDVAYGAAADSSGIYVIGQTGGSLPGQSSAGGYDAFIAKYDANGNELWTRQFGTAASDDARGLFADTSGIYVVGKTEGYLGDQKFGGADCFIRKYDANGNEIWTRQFGSLGADYAEGVAADSSGIYVTGRTYGLPGFPQGGYEKCYAKKYDADGNEIWTRQFGSTQFVVGHGVAVDSAGGVYIAGYLGGVLPGQTSKGGVDGFLKVYDADGTELLTKQFGTAQYDYILAITDSEGIYMAGETGYSHGTGSALIAKLVFGDPAAAIEELMALLDSMGIHRGINTALDQMLDNAQASLNAANADQQNNAIILLQVFINLCEVQRGNKLTNEQADQLIDMANAIIEMLQ